MTASPVDSHADCPGQPGESSPSAPARLSSLDAYRGAVMLVLACNGFGLAALAKEIGSPSLDWLVFHTTHPAWISQFRVIGFSLWDMIMPAFLFIVGVAVPYSFAKRRSRGESPGRILGHALRRAVLLILLGIFLQSLRAKETNWIFINVLSQIGLGYGAVVALAGRRVRTQAIAGALILAASWLVYVLYPVAEPTAAAAGVPGRLPGFFAHWSIHANAGAAFDRWFLNLFPQSKPFTENPGGYVTINFIASIVTMILGLMCGGVVRDPRRTPAEKLRRLVLGGAACLGLGALLGLTVCPVVKRLWTPSWTLFSGAFIIWMLALFYWVIDVRGLRRWAFPLVVAGMNPMALYMMGSTLRGWVIDRLHAHLPASMFVRPWGHVADAALAGLIFWMVCWWMHRRKVYIRL